MMKKILVASFYFPPYADIAGTRAVKTCKYLPEYKWDPWVLTVDKRYYGEKMIASLPSDIEKIRITSLPYVPVFAAKTLASLLYPLMILFYATKYRKQVDAVCMIGSPYHPFLLTPVINKILNIPVVLDFRDSWSYNYGFDGTSRYQAGFLAKLKQKVYFFIERIAVAHASLATFATSTLKDEYSKLIPKYRNKYHTIYNGYDEDDFKNIKPVSIAAGKTILLAGKFNIYTPDAVEYFLEVLKVKESLTFIYIGNEYDIIRSLAEKIGVEKRVVTMKFQPYAQVLQFIAGADYCLLSTGLKNGMGTKIFDYLALSKPTLCLIPQGSIITQQFASTPGIVISEAPHTRERIKDSLQRLLSLDSSKADNHFKQFSRRKLTEKLAVLLNKSISSAP